VINSKTDTRLAGTHYNEDDFLVNAEWVFNAKPVKELDGTEFSKSDVDLITQVTAFFRSIGSKTERDDLGSVELTRQGVKDSLGHGIGRDKASAFMAVPDVIKHGRIIDRQINWKNRGKDRYVIDAPIAIRSVEYIAEVVIEQNLLGKNRYYLHEVEVKEKARNVFKTATERSTFQASRLVLTKKIQEKNLTINNIPQNSSRVKPN